MRQLFQNLIGNALKFHKPGEHPHVLVQGGSPPSRVPAGAGPYAAWCHITVQDNGIGFEQKHVERIFGVFQRLHLRREYGGSGIGLAVCRRIVERHGGTITAEGRPGQGAVFTVRLPTEQSNTNTRYDT
jgi:signal transduction histidine kinase